MAVLRAAATELAVAFPDPIVRQFSVKANDVAGVVAVLHGFGLGANVVSGGEWAIARRAGVPHERITIEGIGKTDADLRRAVRQTAAGTPPAWLAIESPDEAEALIAIARRARLGTADRPPLDVLFRLNPAVVPETAAGLAVGAAGAKFGMTETELTSTVERVARMPTARSSRAGSTSTSGPSSAPSMRGAMRCVAGWRCWACCGADSTASTRSTSAAAFRSAHSAGPVRAPNASHGSSRRSSRRSPSTGNHGGSSSNRDASSSPVPAGWWPASSTSVTAPAPTWSARSCSTPG